MTTRISEPGQAKPVCTIIGVGPGTGAAFARRFAAEGYRVAMLARNADLIDALAAELPQSRAYVTDASDTAALARTLSAVADEMGAIDVLIYNAGKGIWGSATEVSLADFEEAWRVNALGALAAAQAVAPAMQERGSGQIVFVGATASRRGGAKTAAFAPAKAAQRSLAESLAKSLGPSGVHVSLIVIDGIIDEPLMRAKFSEKAESFFVKPADIADTAVMLTRQRRSAWSFEVEARPFGETW